MPGRPSKGEGARTNTVTIKLNIPELEAVKAAAEASGKTLRDWIRDYVLSLVEVRPAKTLFADEDELNERRFAGVGSVVVIPRGNGS